MFIEEKIASIKSKYKELYKVDVDIQYNKETGEYILIDDDQDIVKTIKSLDEELLELEKSKSYDDGVYRDYSSESHDGEERRNNNKIDIYYSKMISVINAINTMAGSVGSVDTSYASCLTGELRAYYDSLGDNTPEAVRNLAGSITGVAAATETSVSLCYNVGKENLKDLEELINEFYQYAKEMNEKSQIAFDSDEVIKYDDYTFIFDNMDEMFDGRYEDIINRFKYNLAIGYQNFLKDTVPETIDNIIENTYLRISEEEIGSSKYQEGLNEFKESFGLKVLNEIKPKDFKIEDSNIPEYLWNDADNYHKSLLMLSYNNDNFSNSYRENIIGALKDVTTDMGLYVDYIEDNEAGIISTFDILERSNNFYNRDFEKEYASYDDAEKLKKIVAECKAISEDNSIIEIGKNTFYGVAFVVPVYNEEAGKAWEQALKENGYLENIDGKYEIDSLYKNTFTNEFVSNVIERDGQGKVYQLLKSYYKNYGLDNDDVNYKLDSIFRGMDSYLLNNVVNYNINKAVQDNLGVLYNKLLNDKITLDATKANFKLGLLESLDTADITNADVIEARKIIGNDAKYLEDWQIKGYYKIYQNDKERAKNIIDDTLHNIIIDGKGYEKAKERYALMTGEPSKEIMEQLTHNAIFSDIWGKTSGFIYTGLRGFSDGVGGSIRNVGDIALADGKMDANDYYLMHLQEMLSAGGLHNDALKLTYNATSSVGNMAIPMALSAFVSPLAMSSWIFLAETGSSREQALRSGEENDLGTFINAAAHGLLAVGVERALGSLKGYGAKSDELLKVFTGDGKLMTKLMNSGIGKKLALGLSNSVNETIEELVENIGGYTIDLLSGKDIDVNNIPKETWETIYMTMLTTPLINLMGGSFQNSKYSQINRLHTYNFDGFDVEYSQAELMIFTDKDGNFDEKGFMEFLAKEGRIKNINEENLREKQESINSQYQNNGANVEVIDVSEIDTGRHNSLLDHGVDPNVMNMSYKNYNYVYKISGDVNSAIEQVTSDHKDGKILIEIDSTVGLTRENLSKLPPNVEIRVLGDYKMEYFKGDKSNGSSIATLEKATYSVSEMQDIMSKIKSFENGIDPNWSDIEKAKYAYDFMVDNIEYNPNPGGIIVRDRKHVGLLSLVANESTCQGFAHTYKELLTRMGIECTEISGSLNGEGQHAFNVVTIDGKKYIVDTVRESMSGNYNGSGFGVDLKYLSEYNFYSNTDLQGMISDGSELNGEEQEQKKLYGHVLGDDETLHLYPGFDMQNNKKWNNYSTEDFASQFQTVTQNGVTYYIANGEDFKFLVHVIDSKSGIVKYNGSDQKTLDQIEYLQKNLPTHPELFVMSDLDTKTLSCSTISDKAMPLFSAALRSGSGAGNIILGFNENDLNKVYGYFYHDAGLDRRSSPIGYDVSVNELSSERGNIRSGFDYDEVVLSRDGRMPNYIVSPFPPGDSRNADNITWAKAYGIPIVYINTNTYAQKYRSEIQTILAKTKNGECLTNEEYQKVLSLKGSIDAISSSYDINELKSLSKTEIDTFKSNPTKENADILFSIEGGELVSPEYINASNNGDKDNKIFDAIILHYNLESKFPNLTRDEIVENLMESAKIPRSMPSFDFDFELKRLNEYDGDKKKHLKEFDAMKEKIVDLSYDEISNMNGYNLLSTDEKIELYTEKLQSLADARGIEVKDFANMGKNDIYSKEEIAEAHDFAVNIHAQAKISEPKITTLMYSFEDENCYLTGLENKLKDVDSIERKVLFDHHHSGLEIDEAAKGIGDSVRYTMIIDDDHYTEKAQETLKTLVSKGYKIRENGARNTWNNGLYKGLNCSIISPDGINFELQFHTESSFDVKEDKTHLVYEIRRNEAISKGTGDLAEVRESVTEIQRLYTSTIPIPKDVIGHDFMKGAYE